MSKEQAKIKRQLEILERLHETERLRKELSEHQPHYLLIPARRYELSHQENNLIRVFMKQHKR